MKQYIKPEMQVSKFEAESIMTLSGTNNGDFDGTVIFPKNTKTLYIEEVELAF